jgi:hypothetical protein
LFREEKCIPRHTTIAPGKVRSSPPHLHPLADDFILAALVQAETGGIPVRLCVLAMIVKTGVTVTCPARKLDLADNDRKGLRNNLCSTKAPALCSSTSLGIVLRLLSAAGSKISESQGTLLN